MSESRQQNTPSPAAHIRAAKYVRYGEKTPPEERDDLQRVLLFGGWETLDPYEKDPQPRGTWIYTPAENSWFHIRLKEQPSDRFGHSLTTVCRNTVVLYGGIPNFPVKEDSYKKGSHVNTLPPSVSELWIFDGLQEVWHEIHSENPPPPRAFHSAVSFGSGATAADGCSECLCQHSIFIFGGLTKGDKPQYSNALDDLVELQCRLIGEYLPSCRWIRHERQVFWPDRRFFHFAASFENQTILMFGGEILVGNKTYGERTLWSLNVSSGSWNQKNYSIQLDESNTEDAGGRLSAFVSDAVKERILQIRKGKVYSYHEERNGWVQDKVFIGSSTPVNMRDFAAVTVNGTIVVFAGTEPHTSFLSTRVWNVQMINGSWIWQLQPPPRTNPPLQALASWTVIGDRLIFAARASHEWAVFLCQSWAKFMHVVTQSTKYLNSALRRGNFPNQSEFVNNVKSLVGHFSRLEIGLNATINSVWQMDLENHTWWQYSAATNNRPLFYTADTGIHRDDSSVLITYGGSSVSEFRNLTPSSSTSPYSLAVNRAEIFIYVLGRRRWTRPKLNDKQPDRPVARVFPTLTHTGDGHSMILFGGAAVNGEQVTDVINSRSTALDALKLYKEAKESMKNDVWELTMSANWSQSEVDNITISWKLLNSSNVIGPEGRLGHTALVVKNLLVIWGGLRLHNIDFKSITRIVECAHVLWVFDLAKRTWKSHEPISSVSECWNADDLCRAPAVVLGYTVVTIHHAASQSNDESNCSRPSFLSIEVGDTGCKLQPHNLSFPFKPEHIFTWNKTVLVAKQELGNDVKGEGSQAMLNLNYQDKIYTSQMTPGCREGNFSADWGTEPCQPCNIYSYASPGQHECTPCPEGLFTYNTSAAFLDDCLCDPSHCKHGRCFIARTNRSITAECQCDFGFTGRRCQHATYFIIAAVSLASLIIFVLLLVFIRQMIKYKRQKTAKESELEEMSRVWTIKRSEVALMERIDDGEPGSYGDVYKARYRDMTVALKKLKLRTREFEREFQREIHLMKSMRHENIVLFLGAGTFKSDDCPFLVVEYMENGALASVLRNNEIRITREKEIKFCLDVAKGMEFLHSHRPPRIHRDLKSSNLLVSALWVVKIADFGCARLVKGLGVTQSVSKRKVKSCDRLESATEPLLRAESAMSDSVGSALWRAPEIFSGEAYGTSVDVYR